MSAAGRSVSKQIARRKLSTSTIMNY